MLNSHKRGILAVGAEAHVEKQPEVEVVVITATDVIANEQIDEKIQSIIIGIENYEANAAEAEVAVESLSRQIEIEKVALAAGNVSTSTVQLAIESLNSITASLGADDVYSIGIEDIEASPVKSLEIAIEEKAEVIKRIVEKIKEIFKAIWEKIQKLVATVAMKFAASEKTVKSMIEEVKALKGGEVSLDDPKLESIRARFGALIGLTSAFDKTTLVGVIGKYAALKPLNFGDGASLSALETSLAARNISKGVLTIKDLEGTFNGLPTDAGDVEVAVSRIDGGSISVFAVTTADKDGKPVDGSKITDLAEAKEYKAMAIASSATVKDDAIKGVKVEALNTADLIAVLEAVLNMVKNGKSVTEALKKDGDATTKLIDEAVKAADKEDAAAIVKATNSKVYGKLIPKLSQDSVFGYLNFSKACLWLAKLHVDNYTKAAE